MAQGAFGRTGRYVRVARHPSGASQNATWEASRMLQILPCSQQELHGAL